MGLLHQGNNTAVSLGSEIDSALAEERVAAAILSLLDGENKGDIRHAYKVLNACLKDQGDLKEWQGWMTPPSSNRSSMASNQY